MDSSATTYVFSVVLIRVKEPEQELEEELDRNQEYEEQEEWNNSQDVEEPEQELEEEMDGDQEQWDQNEKQQPDQRNMNIDELHYLDVLHGRLLGSLINFHWQLGGYNNHQPCSSNDISHCSSSHISTELDSAVSSF